MGRPWTKSEVSERTGVPVKTLEHWRYRGRGEGPRSFRLGRRVMYRPEDVEAWIYAAREADVMDGAA